MSMFEDDNYQWRETYFVLFDAGRRPSLEQMIETLTRLNARFRLRDSQADEDGRFESITLIAPDDFAAVDIAYIEGEEVIEQGLNLSTEMQSGEAADAKKLAKLPTCDARFDVMHFEQTPASDGDEPEEMLDPSSLLAVLDELIRLTGGVGVDPQSGALI